LLIYTIWIYLFSKRTFKHESLKFPGCEALLTCLTHLTKPTAIPRRTQFTDGPGHSCTILALTTAALTILGPKRGSKLNGRWVAVATTLHQTSHLAPTTDFCSTYLRPCINTLPAITVNVNRLPLPLTPRPCHAPTAPQPIILVSWGRLPTQDVTTATTTATQTTAPARAASKYRLQSKPSKPNASRHSHSNKHEFPQMQNDVY